MGRFECCHGCTDRFVGCKTGCKKYNSAKEEHERIKSKIRKENSVSDYFSVKNARIERIQQKMRK